MQSLIAAPRSAFTVAQLVALLQAPDLDMVAGVELLDGSDNFVSDLSSYLMPGGSISHDSNAPLCGSCSLTLSIALQWGHDRIRPYVLCSSVLLGLSNVRFNLGIYIATSPSRPLGEVDASTNLPITTYAVTGYDKSYLLSQVVGDTVIAGQGANVLTQVTNQISAATNGDPKISLDSTANLLQLAADITWPLSGTPATYLDVINDLLATINYVPIWLDADGYFRSGPYVSPATATPEWTFTVQDTANNIVAEPRTVTQDTWGIPNWWRFLQNGLSAAPTEGQGQYTYTDTSSPNTGYGARGYYVKKIVSVDAVDQPTLQAIAQQQIVADTNKPETFSLSVGPLPQAGHFDIVVYNDKDIDGGITNRKLQVQSWTFNLDGSEMSITADTALVVSA